MNQAPSKKERGSPMVRKMHGLLATIVATLLAAVLLSGGLAQAQNVTIEGHRVPFVRVYAGFVTGVSAANFLDCVERHVCVPSTAERFERIQEGLSRGEELEFSPSPGEFALQIFDDLVATCEIDGVRHEVRLSRSAMDVHEWKPRNWFPRACERRHFYVRHGSVLQFASTPVETLTTNACPVVSEPTCPSSSLVCGVDTASFKIVYDLRAENQGLRGELSRNRFTNAEFPAWKRNLVGGITTVFGLGWIVTLLVSRDLLRKVRRTYRRMVERKEQQIHGLQQDLSARPMRDTLLFREGHTQGYYLGLREFLPEHVQRLRYLRQSENLAEEAEDALKRLAHAIFSHLLPGDHRRVKNYGGPQELADTAVSALVDIVRAHEARVDALRKQGERDAVELRAALEREASRDSQITHLRDDVTHLSKDTTNYTALVTAVCDFAADVAARLPEGDANRQLLERDDLNPFDRLYFLYLTFERLQQEHRAAREEAEAFARCNELLAADFNPVDVAGLMGSVLALLPEKDERRNLIGGPPTKESCAIVSRALQTWAANAKRVIEASRMAVRRQYLEISALHLLVDELDDLRRAYDALDAEAQASAGEVRRLRAMLDEEQTHGFVSVLALARQEMHADLEVLREMWASEYGNLLAQVFRGHFPLRVQVGELVIEPDLSATIAA